MKPLLIACTAVMASLGLTPVTDAAPATCWETEAPADGGVPWRYTHAVKWCGNGTGITSVSPPTVSAAPVDETCVWLGVRETSTTRRGDSWESFSMGAFSCEGTDGQVNPWMIVVVHPGGGHDVEQGVAGY